jgi:hypothetical protein
MRENKIAWSAGEAMFPPEQKLSQG